MAREKGIKAGFVKTQTIWPFPDELICRALGAAHRVIVAEMSVGKLVREVERAVAGKAKIELFSKPGISLHTPQEIISFIRETV